MRSLPPAWFPVAVALAGVGLFALVFLVGASLPLRADASEPERVSVEADTIAYDDGDSFAIVLPEGREDVRILGIDAPEVLHLDHDIPYAQPFGDAAAAFFRGCVAAADKLELLRTGEKDTYGRTLGYLYVDGRNYSALLLRARLAIETVSRYGDNGLPEPAGECRKAAEGAGPVAFENPGAYRRRMRQVSAWMRENGTYPVGDGE